MASNPPRVVPSSEFEFDALGEAHNYRRALIQEFGAFLKGRVIDAGAGIGQVTELLQRQAGVCEVLAVEPELTFCQAIEQHLPGVKVFHGTVANLPPTTSCNVLVCINVLEHIQDDAGALREFNRILAKERGVLCLFVPAGPEIFTPLDRKYGHYRRYSKSELKRKLEVAGFELLRLDYYNFPGYLAWWLLFRVFRLRRLRAGGVKLFDRYLFPVIHWFERRIARPPCGQSLIGVARPKP
ncbi:MAG: methyltransferase domain-containing protein [Verrucomicrobiota bacterium]